MSSCVWKRTKRKSPTVAEWRCEVCGRVDVGTTEQPPSGCTKQVAIDQNPVEPSGGNVYSNTNYHSNEIHYGDFDLQKQRSRLWYAAAVAVLVVVFPLLMEQKLGTCRALESRFTSNVTRYLNNNSNEVGAAIMMNLIVGAGQGQMGEFYVKTEYPYAPPFVGCIIGYYVMLFNGEASVKSIYERLNSSGNF